MALAMVARNAYVATARCLVAPAFRVHGPATHVWNQLQSGRSVHEIAQLLQVQFPDYRVSAQDVSAFLADLQLLDYARRHNGAVVDSVIAWPCVNCGAQPFLVEPLDSAHSTTRSFATVG